MWWWNMFCMQQHTWSTCSNGERDNSGKKREQTVIVYVMGKWDDNSNHLWIYFSWQIPCRTAMRGSFPLNGTYFQVNEVNTTNFSSTQASIFAFDKVLIIAFCYSSGFCGPWIQPQANWCPKKLAMGSATTDSLLRNLYTINIQR